MCYSLTELSRTRKAVKQAIADHALRAQQLDAALATYALTRRDDSRLCEAFDAGEPIGWRF